VRDEDDAHGDSKGQRGPSGVGGQNAIDQSIAHVKLQVVENGMTRTLGVARREINMIQ
jgi:hypothetical protein